MKNLKASLVELVHQQIQCLGFRFVASKDSFVRRRDGRTDVFQLVWLDAKPGWRIQPNIGVRIDEIEDLFHKTSGFEPKYQRDTVTVGGSVGCMLGSDNRDCEFILESESELVLISDSIASIFKTVALPYFERFSSISAIDAELNNSPLERTPNRVNNWLRCSTGIIVAKLTFRSNYLNLVSLYSEVLAKTNKGFYLNRFHALVESLNGL